MSAIRRMAGSVRTVPLVFKLSTALLIVALAIGQLTQLRPAGRVSLAILATITNRCPAASPHEARPTVINAELPADRAMRWVIADRLLPHSGPRCGTTVTGEPSASVRPIHRRVHYRHHR